MKVKVICAWPEYAMGEHVFHSLEEVFNWLLNTIKRFPKRSIGGILYSIGKDGDTALLTGRHYYLKFESDFHDYWLTQKTALETRLIRNRDLLADMGISNDLNTGLAFAKAFDTAVKEGRKVGEADVWGEVQQRKNVA